MELTRPRSTATPRDAVRAFLGVVVRGQTYRNVAYLLLTFPLGLCYFVFLVTGFSLSLGLAVVLVGVPLLVGMLVAVNLLTRFERWLAGELLGVEIPVPEDHTTSPDDVRERLRTILVDRRTWTGLVYLPTKFATGLVWFVLIVTLLVVSISLLLAPLYYDTAGVSITLPWASVVADVWVAETAGAIYGNFISVAVETSIERIDTLGEALLASAGGLVAVLCTLHLLNGAARVEGAFARTMLRARDESS